MKKYFFLIGILGLILVGCNRDEENNDDSNGDWIDIGLPSGILWARCLVDLVKP